MSLILPENSWSPTPTYIVEAALTLAEVGMGRRVVDLGCGDGRFVQAALKRGALAYGVELDPKMVWLARRRLESAPSLIEEGDVFSLTGELEDIVVWSLSINQTASDFLRSRCTSTARILTQGAPLPGFVVEKELDIPLARRKIGVASQFKFRGFDDYTLLDGMTFREVRDRFAPVESDMELNVGEFKVFLQACPPQ